MLYNYNYMLIPVKLGEIDVKQNILELTCPITLSLMYSPSFLSPKSSAEGLASCNKKQNT